MLVKDGQTSALSVGCPAIDKTLPDPRPLSLQILDRALAGALLFFTSPAILLAALAVRLLSRRSPFVSHFRTGRNGRQFPMLKLRTMWLNAAPLPAERGWIQHVVSHPAHEIKPRTDPRVTSRFAAWCRTYSVDELPQLWHAVRGEMSLVGPRPLTQFELEKHYGAQAAEILSVPPGLTGLWQILGRNNLDYRKRRRLDLFLARKTSLGLYRIILLRTIPRVVSGSGAW